MTYDHPGARIRIGIVGATPEGGWAAMAHIPAIRAVPSLTLQAVATHDPRRQQTHATASAVLQPDLDFSKLEQRNIQ